MTEAAVTTPPEEPVAETPAPKPRKKRTTVKELREVIGGLESQLGDKDEVISALTGRLEQAAEQLDRLQRNGSSRGSSSGSSDSDGPHPLRAPVLEDLESFVGEWNDMQLAATMGRVELALDEIRELVGSAPPNSSPAPVSSAPPPTVSVSENADWETMKAELLGEPPPATQNGEEPFDGVEIAEAFVDVEAFSAPEPVAEDETDPILLRQAIERRDQFAAELLAALRTVGTQRYRAPEWEKIENAPEELAEALEELEERMTETLKIAEVELSMERARLGREETRLKQIAEQLEGADADEDDPRNAKKGNRWRRLLGIVDS